MTILIIYTMMFFVKRNNAHKQEKEMKKMTMTKLGTMIYENGADSYSVFTLNFEIQNQLDNISCHSPELCCKLPTDDSSGKMYRIKNLKLLFSVC